MLNKRKFLILLWLVIIFSFLIPQNVYAQFSFSSGLMGSISGACSIRGDCDLCDFIDIFVLIANAILAIFAAVALFFIINGGFTIITAAGSPEKVKEGRKAITNTLFAVLIILGAWLLVQILIVVLAYSTSAPPPPPGSQINLFNRAWWLPCEGQKRCDQKHPGWECKSIESCFPNEPEAVDWTKQEIKNECFPPDETGEFNRVQGEFRCDFNLCSNPSDICCRK